MNRDLIKVNAWANQWKMTMNLGPEKQAQEIIFSLNDNSVKQVQFQKHLGRSIGLS